MGLTYWAYQRTAPGQIAPVTANAFDLGGRAKPAIEGQVKTGHSG